jgi:chromosome segregation ATPase
MSIDLLFNYINAIESLLRWLSQRIRVLRFGPLEIELRRKAETEFDATFQKIEKARENLTEAVTALDDLRDRYADEQERLTNLLNDVKQKRAEYAKATGDLTKTRELLRADQETLRRVLGINDRRSKIIGFVSGVLASLIATLLWFGGSKIWNLIGAWIKTIQLGHSP